MLVVQLVDHALRVGIMGVPLHLAHRHPPEPVLHDVVDRDVQCAILRCNALDLRLRLVLVLALPEAVGPAPEERHFARQFAIVADDLVGFRAVDKVVVDAVGDFGADIERMNESVIHAAARGIVPEDAVAVGRDQQRNRDLRVLLRQVDGLAAIVPYAGLVLAEAIEALM